MLSPDRRPARLLLADANRVDREGLAECLQEAGFEVDQVPDSPSALDAVGRTPFELVMVDAGLPTGGAAELCRALRRQPKLEGLRVLIMLDTDDLDSVDELLASGASDLVQRPCHRSLLVHRVRKTMLADAGGAAVPKTLSRESAQDSSPHALVEDSTRFLSRVADAILRAKNADLNVAVLFAQVSSDEADGEPCTAQVAGELQRAVQQFENRDVLSHPRGRIQISHIGDSNYALLIPDLGRIQDAAKLGSEIKDCIESPFVLDFDVSKLQVHIGISTYPADGFEADELIKRSKCAAAEARQEGGSNVQFFNGSMNRWAFERLTLEQNLRQAIERNELTVYYQPKMEILSRKVIGVEALVRWCHPTLGMISPGQFIPLAEETGLIVPIGEWVLGAAARQNQAWQEQGYEPIRMAVNLSPAQFRQPNLFEVVTRIVHEAGMDCRWLELELTEGMLMQDAQTTIQVLRKLKNAGIHLSIDDFGTGYSSLSYLKRFPINTLKIDQSFVRDVTTNPEDAAIATSIILMGHSLKLNVIAEGVETDSQLSFLKILQCNEVQGYLISPPVPPDKAAAFLTKSAV
jgi:EAL domain-containing protein (putative c-di-GMP-specific phosphodiesterase class I)/DNA-binding response OmpR family regulator